MLTKTKIHLQKLNLYKQAFVTFLVTRTFSNYLKENHAAVLIQQAFTDDPAKSVKNEPVKLNTFVTDSPFF